MKTADILSRYDRLALFDCVVGANRCASTAADASIGIDLVDITL